MYPLEENMPSYTFYKPLGFFDCVNSDFVTQFHDVWLNVNTKCSVLF